jgi:adenine phosphoribosyltransferase
MARTPPHELSIDELFARAWQGADVSLGGGPRTRRFFRNLDENARNELSRRGFDVELALELDDQIAEVDGHADIWRIFLNGDLFARTVRAMSTPFHSDRITKVIGIEARGFLLGGAVAVELGAGFVPVRKGGHLPGPKLSTAMTGPDYRGMRHELRLQARALGRRDRVLLVDDWIEMGSQAAAVMALIQQAHATFAGASVIVNQLPVRRMSQFGRLRYLVRYFPNDDK